MGERRQANRCAAAKCSSFILGLASQPTGSLRQPTRNREVKVDVSVKAARAAAGYSLVEVLLVTGIMAVVAAIAVPTVGAAMRRYALNNLSQQVAATIRSARYTAVAKNKVVRVRFDCPANDQYRMVEFTAMSTIDDDVDRCSVSDYPYPDTTPDASPNVDGPVIVVPAGTELGVVTDLEIDARGRLTPLAGCPTCTAGAGTTASVILENGFESQTVTVDQTGQVVVGDMVSID